MNHNVDLYVSLLVAVARGDSTKIAAMTYAWELLTKDETARALEIGERKGVLPKGSNANYLAKRRAHATRMRL